MSAVIEQWPLSRFIPYEHNPRKNDQAVPQMMQSIREFGFKIPILAKSDGSVVDGHLRLKAALELRLTEAPVILCDEWSEQQVKAFRLLVNRSATWADWDEELLASELEQLKDFNFDLSLTGFEANELEQIFASSKLTQETEWQDMPEFHQDDQLAFHTIKVHFRDVEGIEQFAKLIAHKLTTDTRFIWFPLQENVVVADKRFASQK